MSNRNWHLIILGGLAVALLTLIGGWTWPKNPILPKYDYAHVRNDNYRPGGQKCDPAMLAGGRQGKGNSRKDDACAREAEEYRLATDGLLQQARAANAAEVQAEFTRQQLLTAWVQTIGGLLTLCAAVAAAWYAKGAADAARQSLDHAQTIGDLQVRPYLSARYPKLKLMPNGEFEIKSHIINSGILPAVEAYCNIFAEVVDMPLEDNFSPAITRELMRFDNIIPNPTRNARMYTYLKISKRDMDDIDRWDKIVVCRTVVRYRPLPHLPVETVETVSFAFKPEIDEGSFRVWNTFMREMNAFKKYERQS